MGSLRGCPDACCLSPGACRIARAALPDFMDERGALPVEEAGSQEAREVNEAIRPQSGAASEVIKIYGTAPAIAACERQLRSRYPDAILVDVQSGQAAAHFALGDDQAAALGSALLKELYDLKLIDDRLEDDSDVVTRFGVVGNRLPSRTGQDRTVLAMAPGDQPGALHRALQPLADREINLTRVESRPSTGTEWRHVFFLELDGHITDRAILTAVEELRRIARYAKVLGSYPRPS